MQINNLIPSIINNNIALKINVIANGSPRVDNVNYQILIRPIIVNSIYTPITITGSDFWNDFNINTTGNGYIELINNTINNINTIKVSNSNGLLRSVSSMFFDNIEYSVEIELGKVIRAKYGQK
jgi:hypothetical protein